ncbi:glycosyltransferase [Anaeromicrobium sediminis]|uniref:Glycosyl transferase family 1 domain-containing protein n=1 Tax=Anaeromicrobium sediminis TaxID=1478221 RepID=A0A267MJU1_9FIRM|nr:glycosyltransferase [Anaeromicrobium sediminis]PAB59145.1 hypothetical protein CCE28_11545 [Anaeromicrobium sediminis]
MKQNNENYKNCNIKISEDLIFDEIQSQLIICRPFLPNKKSSDLSVNYYFIDPNFVDEISLLTITQNYSHVYIERNLVSILRQFLNKINSKVSIIDNITIDKKVIIDDIRIAFLASSDTHVDFMVKIANKFKNILFLIPSKYCKEEGAYDALKKHGYTPIEIDYKAVKSKVLEKFNPDYIFCAADWSLEFLAVQRIVKDKNIPIIALQEGPHDWQQKFWQNIKRKKVLKALNQYRNADIFFSQGGVTLNYIRPKYFAVTGNPKVNKIEHIALPKEPKVLINCNFTYVKTKPPYENNGDMWMEKVLRVCKNLNLKYIISKHPRDELSCNDPNLVKSNASRIRDQIISCSISISRFSSIIYETLALSRPTVYFNPHLEPMLTFTEDLFGMPNLTTTEEGLTRILQQHKKNYSFDHRKNEAYLHRHIGPQDGKALKRIISMLIQLRKHTTDNNVSIQNLVNDSISLERIGAKRSIAIFVRNSPEDYSIGRYEALMLTEALAALGHKIYYITDNIPIFYSDFRQLKKHKDIEICLTKSFKSNLPYGVKIDMVICVPGFDMHNNFYMESVSFAKRHKASLVLNNFQTLNWVNTFSPQKQDEKLWSYWNTVSKDSSLILSLAHEGTKYAKRFYRNCSSKTLFKYCYPSINSVVADSVSDFPKEKRIVFINPHNNSNHKAGFNISDIFSASMKGYTLVIIAGIGKLPNKLIEKIKQKAKKYGVFLEIKYRISDYEKFIELKKASLLLFPSFFKGYSYPPIEALYCNTPCIAFDLPVLRETCGDSIIYVPVGDWNTLKCRLNDELGKFSIGHRYENLCSQVLQIAKLEMYAKRLDKIVDELCSNCY